MAFVFLILVFFIDHYCGVYLISIAYCPFFHFCLLFPFLLFSISHSSVIYRDICEKDFSGTNALRILKFGTNVGYDMLHCVKENQPPDACHFLYLSIFLSFQSNFLLQISWLP